MKRLVYDVVWLNFPPVFSFFTLMLAVLFRDKGTSHHLPAAVWGVVIAAYVCLCGVSLFFITKRNKSYNTGITLLSQGLLLAFAALQFGAAILSWVGLVAFLVGLVVVFFYATHGSRSLYDVGGSSFRELTEQNEEERERMESLLEKLALPILITDTRGIVLGGTSRFYEATGKNPKDVEGEIVTDVLPIDREEVVFDSGKWWLSQIKEGARHYFSLLPTPDCKPPASTPEPQGPKGLVLYDPQTGLYTDEYRMIRGPEEVSRAQRYTRQLSGILLELFFEISDGIDISEQQQKMLFTAFAVKVKEILRSMDSAFLMEGRRIQILLPETPGGGAKVLLSRIMTLLEQVFDEDVRRAVNPKVKAGTFFYNGASRMEYGIFSATLEEALIKAKETAGNVAA